MTRLLTFACLTFSFLSPLVTQGDDFEVAEDDQQIKIVTPDLEAAIRKKGYVSGIAAGSFLDRKTGFRDAGFGLDIVDWIMEPGSDEAYRDALDEERIYRFNTPYHGSIIPKRSIEGPQICTQAKVLEPRIIRGHDFVAAEMSSYFSVPSERPGFCVFRSRQG